MIRRLLKAPPSSFFLLGPRATGKTTWLEQSLGGAKWYNLLESGEYLRLSQNPALFSLEVSALPLNSWIVIDEVQRIPALLNEVHNLIFKSRNKYNFALTGSSARKLKSKDVNLLAGRAINKQFFPLSLQELSLQYNFEDVLHFGLLPAVYLVKEKSQKIAQLEAYAVNYLREEIQQEALVRNLQAFHRFLEIAALTNGQILNLAAIARNTGVSRPTAQGYFQALMDTLMGTLLPPWQQRPRVKQVVHPKFYFFDMGVVNALRGGLRDPLESVEKGFLLETLVLHELRSYINFSDCGGQLSYWRTPSGSEVDFIWSRAKTHVGIEVKLAREWKQEFGKALKELASEKKFSRCFAVYTGERVLQDGPITVLPLKEFIAWLYQGKII